MSYLVLARKSRPQKFDQVVGQKPVVRTLQNSIAKSRIAHAILFSGVRGVGKTTLARLMAKAINCTADLDQRPCDECQSCLDISSGASLDLYEIDGASNRGIQEIRELKEKIRFLPTNSNFKVIIIDEVHMLTTEAFNALLKTLEEPPAHVHFMFATTEIHKIPITILSRCQQYELKRVPANELQKHFLNLVTAEGYEIDKAALSLIVREAGGSVRDGLSLLDQMFSFGEKKITPEDVVEILGLVNREVLTKLALGLLNGIRADVFFCLEEIFDFGMDTKRFMDDLLSFFRSLILCKIEGCTDLIDVPGEELTQLQDISTNYSTETLHLKLSLLMETADKIKFSTQPRITLETSFLKIIEATNVTSVAALLGHLEQIVPALADSIEAVPQSTTNIQTSQLEKKNLKIPTDTNVALSKGPQTDFSSSPQKSEATSTPISRSIQPPPAVKQQPPQPTVTDPPLPKKKEDLIPLPEEPQEVLEQLNKKPASAAATESTNGLDNNAVANATSTAGTTNTANKVSTTSSSPKPTDSTKILENAQELQPQFHPHEKDVRKDWPDFIEYVRDRKVWMAKDLQRADSAKHEGKELQLTFSEGAICSLLRQKENLQLLTEFALDFFQKPLKVKIIIPDTEIETQQNGEDSPQKKRIQLANDPLVIMAAEIFNGEVGDIRIGPRSR